MPTEFQFGLPLHLGLDRRPLFVIHTPITVRSTGDWDIHRIGAAQIMNLYGVRQHECIVIDHDREGETGYDRDFLKKLMELRPLTGIMPRRVTADERDRLRKNIYG